MTKEALPIVTADIEYILEHKSKCSWYTVIYFEQVFLKSCSSEEQILWQEHLLQLLVDVPEINTSIENGAIRIQIGSGHSLVWKGLLNNALALVKSVFKHLPDLQSRSSTPQKWHLKAIIHFGLGQLTPGLESETLLNSAYAEFIHQIADIAEDDHILMIATTAHLYREIHSSERQFIRLCGEYQVSAAIQTELWQYSSPYIGNPQKPFKRQIKGLSQKPVSQAIGVATPVLDPLMVQMPIFKTPSTKQVHNQYKQKEAFTFIESFKRPDIKVLKQKMPLGRVPPHLKTLRNQYDMFFERMPAGEFRMGSPESDTHRTEDETFHKVILDHDFYIMTTPVTQKQWKAVMGTNPSYFQGDQLPVEAVSWWDVQEFIQCLNEKIVGLYRLPTEAEWEYVARAGQDFDLKSSCSLEELYQMAWFQNNAGAQVAQQGPRPVATRMPNPWGIYDLLGNVWEWVFDWYAVLPSEMQRNPTGPQMGNQRILRGGRWNSEASTLRVSSRSALEPSHASPGNVGFRLVFIPQIRS